MGPIRIRKITLKVHNLGMVRWPRLPALQVLEPRHQYCLEQVVRMNGAAVKATDPIRARLYRTL